MKNEEEKILKRENRLLKNEKSWRRARIGATLLFIVSLMIILTIYGDDSISKDQRAEALGAVVIWSLFWLLIIDWLTLHLWYIDSIKLYRKRNYKNEGN